MDDSGQARVRDLPKFHKHNRVAPFNSKTGFGLRLIVHFQNQEVHSRFQVFFVVSSAAERRRYKIKRTICKIQLFVWTP